MPVRAGLHWRGCGIVLRMVEVVIDYNNFNHDGDGGGTDKGKGRGEIIVTTSESWIYERLGDAAAPE